MDLEVLNEEIDNESNEYDEYDDYDDDNIYQNMPQNVLTEIINLFDHQAEVHPDSYWNTFPSQITHLTFSNNIYPYSINNLPSSITHLTWSNNLQSSIEYYNIIDSIDDN